MFGWLRRRAASEPELVPESRRDAESKLKQLLDDLTKIEVNTIIKRNISGTAMPPPGQAVAEVIDDYTLELCRIAARLKVRKALKQDQLGNTDGEKLGALHEAAKDLGERLDTVADPSDEDRADRNMLYRIEKKSRSLGTILSRIGDRPGGGRADFRDLDELELMAIRKAWEISTERIVVQTVIQLDGDVVNRIDPDCARDAWPQLLKTHQRLVSVSLSYWGSLFQVVAEFARALLTGLRR